MNTTAPQTPPVAPTPPLRFRQPKQLIRWLTVLLAVAGWIVSYQLLFVSLGQAVSPLLGAVCGGADADGKTGCDSVLTSPEAYIPLGRQPGALRLPTAALGMAYFAFVALWYLFVGPPTRDRRWWHVLITALVIWGAWDSLGYIHSMAYVLHRWCGGCLAAHALNGGLLVLTLLAWPWRKPLTPAAPHPHARLVLATATAGFVLGLLHASAVALAAANGTAGQRTAELNALISDPAYTLWDFNRQVPVEVPLFDDEAFAGAGDAPHTIVIFSDFQCPACRQAHQVLDQVLEQYPAQVRVVYRYYPQDSECNANPKFRTGGHLGACRAARAAEAARQVGGPEVFLKMQRLLYERHAQLPNVSTSRQSQAQLGLFEDWAAELGLDRSAFRAALEGEATAARIAACIAQADKLGISSMPVVYVDGRKLRNWTKLATWETILGVKAELNRGGAESAEGAESSEPPSSP